MGGEEIQSKGDANSLLQLVHKGTTLSGETELSIIPQGGQGSNPRLDPHRPTDLKLLALTTRPQTPHILHKGTSLSRPGQQVRFYHRLGSGWTVVTATVKTRPGQAGPDRPGSLCLN
ncbi:hypothetical protein RRG08_015734 [Elysia crispata]|uniref:Uncharacterized protein n=1 Tax=Elysia crispata TaxID=231223 RepID=A0AAE0Z575_9GAST|nr:hypothetical protein RRG08_015734 [Elysia crispata]